jgi:hypothetical protein
MERPPWHPAEVRALQNPRRSNDEDDETESDEDDDPDTEARMHADTAGLLDPETEARMNADTRKRNEELRCKKTIATRAPCVREFK